MNRKSDKTQVQIQIAYIAISVHKILEVRYFLFKGFANDILFIKFTVEEISQKRHKLTIQYEKSYKT